MITVVATLIYNLPCPLGQWEIFFVLLWTKKRELLVMSNSRLLKYMCNLLVFDVGFFEAETFFLVNNFEYKAYDECSHAQ